MGMHKISFEITGVTGDDTCGWKLEANGHGNESFLELTEEIERLKLRYLKENKSLIDYRRELYELRNTQLQAGAPVAEGKY